MAQRRRSAFFDQIAGLAAIDTSSAWVVSVLALHGWQVCKFAPAAAQEVWDDEHGVTIASTFQPGGSAHETANGWSLRGSWRWCSGIDHCDWVMLGARTINRRGDYDQKTLLVPRTDFTVEHSWWSPGLAATGTNTANVAAALVPSHRVMVFTDQDSYGAFEDDEPLGALELPPLFAWAVAAPALGAVQKALGLVSGALGSLTTDRYQQALQREHDAMGNQWEHHWHQTCQGRPADSGLLVAEAQAMFGRCYRLAQRLRAQCPIDTTPAAFNTCLDDLEAMGQHILNRGGLTD